MKPWASHLRRERDALIRRNATQAGDIARMKLATARLHDLYHAACENRDEAKRALAVAEFERNNASSQCAAAYVERDALAQRLADVEARSAFDSLGRCADSVTCAGMRSKAQHYETTLATPAPMWSTVWADDAPALLVEDD